MVTDIMIDLEFLSLKANGIIMSLGAVAWDIHVPEFKPIRTLDLYPSIDDQLSLGGGVSGDTLMWWLQASQAARTALASGQIYKRNSLEHFLDFFTSWIYSLDDAPVAPRFWSHGAACDIALLKYWYDALNKPVPWHYRRIRDTRTLYEAGGYETQPIPADVVAHDALADAKFQAESVHKAWRLVRGNHGTEA